MARYTGPRLKIIRRLGTALPGLMRTDPDLRRPYPPGQHGPTRRKKLSDYAFRLMEKQKLRYHYGVSEKQLRHYMELASKQKGNKGSNLLTLLERRFDNIIFRAGFAPTIPAARQMARHGHIHINGRRVDIPSFQVRPGDVLTVKENSKWKERVLENMKDPNNLAHPQYLEVADGKAEARMKVMPEREDVPLDMQPQLVVEFYSGR